VRVLGEWSDRSCPRCRQPLVSAVIDLIPVLHCTRCGGNLVTPPNFRRIVESRRAQSAKAPQLRPLAQEQLQCQVNCPNCYRTMDVYPYYGPGNAVIDSCGHCALIWLDHGELKVIITAPNRGRG
jgi:Zn-finger nucleic acid-binding protein